VAIHDRRPSGRKAGAVSSVGVGGDAARRGAVGAGQPDLGVAVGGGPPGEPLAVGRERRLEAAPLAGGQPGGGAALARDPVQVAERGDVGLVHERAAVGEPARVPEHLRGGQLHQGAAGEGGQHQPLDVALRPVLGGHREQVGAAGVGLARERGLRGEPRRRLDLARGGHPPHARGAGGLRDPGERRTRTRRRLRGRGAGGRLRGGGDVGSGSGLRRGATTRQERQDQLQVTSVRRTASATAFLPAVVHRDKDTEFQPALNSQVPRRLKRPPLTCWFTQPRPTSAPAAS
jgi:hypothetical protein